jgi:hypothetical protein
MNLPRYPKEASYVTGVGFSSPAGDLESNVIAGGIRVPPQGDEMHNVIAGFAGWFKMQNNRNESVQVLDTALTVVATLLVATTWAIVRHWA